MKKKEIDNRTCSELIEKILKVCVDSEMEDDVINSCLSHCWMTLCLHCDISPEKVKFVFSHVFALYVKEWNNKNVTEDKGN